MAKIKEQFNKILDITVVDEKEKEITDLVPVESTITEDVAKKDFDIVRGSLIKTLYELDAILPRAKEVAEEIERPSAYEALGTIAKTIAKLSEAIVDNNIKKIKFENDINKSKEENKEEPKQVNNNTLIMCTTKELQDFVQNKILGKKE